MTTRPRTHVMQAAIASAILLFGHVCAAAPRVAIVYKQSAAGEPSGFEVQLRSELQAAGFEVVMIPDSAASPQELEALAERTQSAAAISLDQPPDGVTARVWVTERMTGKTLLRTVRPEKVSPEAPSIIALRAVELLRASLLELNETHPPRGSMPVPASVRAWIAPALPSRPAAEPQRPEVWGVAVGATTLGAPGGIPVGIGPAVGFLWHASRTWTGELRWEGPILGTLHSEVGSATLSQELVTFRARVEPSATTSIISPWATLGLGGHHLGARGSAAVPYSGKSAGGYTLLVLAGFGLLVNAGHGFFVVPELAFAAAGTRPVIHFADRSSVFGGRPWLSSTVSLEFAW